MSMNGKALRRVQAIFVALVSLMATSAAWAQQGYEPVPDKDPTTIAANPFLAGAYGFIWVAVVVYLVIVARGLARAKDEVAALRRKLDSGNP